MAAKKTGIEHSKHAANATSNSKLTQRDTWRGILELARLHKPELTLLAWYPTVWALCLVYQIQGTPIEASAIFPMLLKNYIIVALSHSTGCTINDILDRKVDALVPRTASRPLPSGMITLPTAILAFLTWTLLTLSTTAYLQGPSSLLLWSPTWILSLLYPLAKRFINFPQLILGFACACVLLPAWINGGGTTFGGEQLVLTGVFVIVWFVYMDIFYATMDIQHDPSAGVKSLALTLKPKIHFYLSLLAGVQLLYLSTLAYRTQRSVLFWVLGVGVWAMNNVWHIRGLRIVDGNWAAGSGHTIFERNIGLGFWLSVVEVLELGVNGGLLF